MPLKPPYLLLGFDVDPADPNAGAIIDDVGENLPVEAPLTALGIANMFLVEVPKSKALAVLSTVGAYLRQKDQEHANALRWVVQLCRADEISNG